MEEYFRVGVITTTHGLNGEVKVYPTTEDPHRFEELETCYLAEKTGYRPLTIRSCRYFKNLVILGFEEVQRIEDAQLLKQKELYVDREHAIPLEEGEYYLADVLGSTVVDEEGKKLGTLEDYLETAAQIVYKIRTEAGKEVLIPAVDEFIREVNVEEKRMVIHVIPGMF
ncbi:MAG: ribosome maturation factor RimM [Eubacterium sp.]|nr:ribosome maturation factor RimM [Eubacterium sp.]